MHGRQYPPIAARIVYTWSQSLGKTLKAPPAPQTSACARDRVLLCAPNSNIRPSTGPLSRRGKFSPSARLVALCGMDSSSRER